MTITHEDGSTIEVEDRSGTKVAVKTYPRQDLDSGGIRKSIKRLQGRIANINADIQKLRDRKTQIQEQIQDYRDALTNIGEPTEVIE